MHHVSDKQLAARFGVSRPTIWRWLKSDPTFPRPYRLSPQCTRWRDDEIVRAKTAAKRGEALEQSLTFEALAVVVWTLVTVHTGMTQGDDPQPVRILPHVKLRVTA